MVATIQKWGNSQGIRLPKYLLEAIHWQEGEKINIKMENNKIIIEKLEVAKRKNIKELFENYDDNEQYKPTEEIDWGKPVGKEIW